jgi:uncharacterized protein
MRVTLVLTHQCNMACTYCYAGPKSAKSMSEDTGRQAIDLALARDDGEPLTVGFFGGEPLLAFDRMLALARYARREARKRGRAVIFTVTTNGTVLEERHLRFFAEYGFYVAISLDGVQEAHDRFRPMLGGKSSFERIWPNLQQAARWLQRLDVLMVVSPETVGSLVEVLDLFQANGIYRMSLIPNVDHAWSTEARTAAREAYATIARRYLATRETERPLYVHPFVELRAEREQRTEQPGTAGSTSSHKAQTACGFGLHEVAVAPSGRLYPCSRLVADDTRPEISLGTVAEGVLPERVAQLRAAAEQGHEQCGNEGSCLCVPHMPEYGPERGERLHFLQTLCHEVLDEALAEQRRVHAVACETP